MINLYFKTTKNEIRKIISKIFGIPAAAIQNIPTRGALNNCIENGVAEFPFKIGNVSMAIHFECPRPDFFENEPGFLLNIFIGIYDCIHEKYKFSTSIATIDVEQHKLQLDTFRIDY